MNVAQLIFKEIVNNLKTGVFEKGSSSYNSFSSMAVFYQLNFKKIEKMLEAEGVLHHKLEKIELRGEHGYKYKAIVRASVSSEGEEKVVNIETTTRRKEINGKQVKLPVMRLTVFTELGGMRATEEDLPKLIHLYKLLNSALNK